MTTHSTQFEATQAGMALSAAILLYKVDGARSFGQGPGGTAFASIHAIEHRDGQPTIAAGTPLTRGHLRHWSDALGRNIAPEILPDNILVAHPEVVAWWVPAQVRASYFALSNPPARLRALAERTTLSLPYPAHLFIATRRGLGVYALRESVRPTAATVLLHSPVLNVFIDGQLCWGNIARPKGLNAAAIPEFERAVFDSWSTHPNPGQELTVTGKGGLVHLWDNLAATCAKRFPVSRLKSFDPSGGRNAGAPITLGKLIGSTVR